MGLPPDVKPLRVHLSRRVPGQMPLPPTFPTAFLRTAHPPFALAFAPPTDVQFSSNTFAAATT